MMKYFILFMSIISFSSFAQEAGEIDRDDFFGALRNSGWESQYNQTDEVDFSYTNSQVESNGPSKEMAKPCEQDDENTVPYGFFLSLLAGHKLDISQDPETGIMDIKGGTMIGNCNAMLESKVGKPNAEKPYTFQIAIKKSDICSEGKCEYEVYHVDKSVNKKVKKNYTPDFQGYLSCLGDAGVISEGKVQKEKIAPTDFIHTERGVYESSKLLFLSHGFSKSSLTGLYSENKFPGNGCYFYEDIKKGGFSTFSKSDIEKNKQQKLFTKICSSGDYKLISKHIDDFKELEFLQKTLFKVRDQLLSKEIKELHDELASTDDLSDIDTEKYASTIEDFETYIITPLKDKLAIAQKLYATPGSSDKEELLKKIYSDQSLIDKIVAMDIKDFKKEMAKVLDEKSGQLVKYAQSPYLTGQDYVLMVNPKKGSPIDDSRWTGAALTLYKIQNTAFKYGRYNDDFWEANYKGKDQYASTKRFESAVVLDREISENVYKKKEGVELLTKTSKNPDVNYVKNYQEVKVSLMRSIDEQMMSIQQNMQEYQYKIMTNCAVEKQKRYFINQQACVREAQEALENCSEELSALAEQRSAVERKYNALSNKHQDARIQAGLDTSSAGTVISSNSAMDFTFKPNAPGKAQTGWQNQPNPGGFIMNQGIQNQGYMQAGYMPQYQNQNYYQQSPFFQGQPQQNYYGQQGLQGQYGLQFGFNGGMNRSPGSYYGNNGSNYQNQFIQPQSGLYAGQGQNPMSYYQGQYTQPGGPMSFTFQ